MGVLFSVSWKKKTPGRPAERRNGERIRCPKLEPCIRGTVQGGAPDSGGKDEERRQQVQKLVKMGFAAADVGQALAYVYGNEILAIKMLRFAECAWAGNDTNTKLWQPDEQQVQKLVEMGFAEAAVGSALEAVNGDEILAIKMLCFAECGPAGIDTYRKLWQPDEQQVQKLVEIGFAEAAVRSALEAFNGDEILAIKTLRFADCGPAGIETYRKLWQPDERWVQKLVSMVFAEAAVSCSLEAVNGDEILAVNQWQPDEQRVQKLVEMGFTEAAVRSALEAINGDEILAVKMLRFAECARAGNDTTTKLWQPDEQRVQKLVEMGFAEAAVRSALEAVNGVEILAIKMLRFAECAQAGNDTNTKITAKLWELALRRKICLQLWQPDEQQVQKLVEMCYDDAAGRSAVEAPVRSALEAVNGDEILAITMLRFVADGQASIDEITEFHKMVTQKIVAEVAVEVLWMLFIIFLFFVFLLNSEAVIGDEILAFKLMK
uniref:UBA domain-containing protein n=1 Tax=Quercus lobata TaxID=97700 RepID=A0A7N2MMS0_QUELO